MADGGAARSSAPQAGLTLEIAGSDRITHALPIPEMPPRFTVAAALGRLFRRADPTSDYGDSHVEEIDTIDGVLCTTPARRLPPQPRDQLGTMAFSRSRRRAASFDLAASPVRHRAVRLADLAAARSVAVKRRRLRLVHTADVHLGELPARGAASPPDADQRAFARSSTWARRRADALLIAGDRSTRTACRSRPIRSPPHSSAGRCRSFSFPEPDCYDASSIYRRFDFRGIGAHVYPLYAEEGEACLRRDRPDGCGGRAWSSTRPQSPMAGAPGRDGAVPRAEHWLVAWRTALRRGSPRAAVVVDHARRIAGSGLDTSRSVSPRLP